MRYTSAHNGATGGGNGEEKSLAHVPLLPATALCLQSSTEALRLPIALSSNGCSFLFITTFVDATRACT